jgi:hypothetical protein
MDLLIDLCKPYHATETREPTILGACELRFETVQNMGP